MSALTWHGSGTKKIEAGVKEVALFVMNDAGTGYSTGVAWNGVTGITENPSGGDKTDLYADDEKYVTLRGTESFGITIEAYTYPNEWAACDGSIEDTAKGVFLGQQVRKAFGLVYKTSIGDDTHPGMDKGYKLHICYNMSASPSSRGYATINDNPDAISFSWDAESTPVGVTAKKGDNSYKSVSCITIDSTATGISSSNLTALLTMIYGGENQDPTLPTPDQVLNVMRGTPNP